MYINTDNGMYCVVLKLKLLNSMMDDGFKSWLQRNYYTLRSLHYLFYNTNIAPGEKQWYLTCYIVKWYKKSSKLTYFLFISCKSIPQFPVHRHRKVSNSRSR
uniref:Uncharacterized protein n=1 Tax=Cacopsylla melanoneura TaxID=428564 RepID=A0A8D8TU52_9HEMI